MSRFLRPSRRQQHRNSAYWLGSIGGIFFSVGLGFLVLGMVPTVFDAMRMRQWEPVQAQVLEAWLTSSRSDGGNATSRAHARYRYEVAGRAYVGERVAVSNVADNLGDYWYQLGWQLKSAQQQGKAVTAWVNPSDPTEAVLDRDLRWPLLGFWGIFLVVFGGVGGGLLAWARHSWREAAKPEHPLAASQPWMAYPGWTGPSIASNMRAERWVFTGMGLVFLVFGSSVSALALPQAVNGRPIVWVVLVFPLVGLVMCWHALQRWRQHRRYGTAALVLTPHPAPLGGRVVMHLDLPVQASPKARVVMALSCLERSTNGSGEDRRTSESLQWENEGVARTLPTTSGTRIQWHADVPGHLPASVPPGEDGTVWRVSITGQGLGGDFSAHYDIPVFATEAGTTFPAAGDAFALGEMTPASDESLLRERIAAVCHVAQDMQGRLVLEQPYARMRRAQLPWLFMGLGCLASGGYLWRQDALGGWLGVVFGAIGMLAVGLSLWHLCNRRTITIERSQGVTIERSLAGLPMTESHHHALSIQRLGLHRSFGLQVSGQRPESIWQVRAHPYEGKAFVLVDSISGEAAARLLMRDIVLHTGWSTGA
jgi:hypothetical protein